MFRIAMGGIAHESCTFSPLPMRLEDFSLLRGEALLARYPFLAGKNEVKPIPLLHSEGLPGGVVPTAVYETFKNELLTTLQAAMPLDGVYLDLHGALFVADLLDAEADLVTAVRQVVGQIVGPDCLLAASYDLHGNLSAAVVGQLDILTAYRTAPHTDAATTRERAFGLLLAALKKGKRPFKAFAPIPLLLPGERAMTTVEPGASLYAQVTKLSQTDGILDASLLIGYAWADEPRVGSSVFVMGEEKTAVCQVAHQLAQNVWAARHQFAFGMPTGSVDDCISQALAAPESTVFISDAGDNPTGGGVGDVPFVLERLLARGVERALFASLVDETAVSACFAAGAGAVIPLSLGGKLDPIYGQPLAVSGRVVALHEGANRQATIQIDGVTLLLTAQRTAFTTLTQFKNINLDPLDYKIVVVKLGYLFPELRQVAPLSILAFSPGTINPDVTQLPYQHLRRPIFPLEPDFNFVPPPC